MQRIHKDQQISYQICDHRAPKDGAGNYYCRAIHAVLPRDVVLCADCPLSMIGDSPEHFHCRYYDFAGVAPEMDKDPHRAKEYVDALITAGLSEIFPEYVEKGRKDAIVQEKAIRFAAVAHRGAVRKGNKIPYIAHPMETMMLVARMTTDAAVIAAAALHDVVEDTEFTASDIRAVFGDRIADLVCMESENKRNDLPREATWKIRKAENLRREKDAPREAKLIMLADKVSNMRSTVRDFRKEGRSIWQKFNMKDEWEQAWYYRSVAKVLSELSNEEIYQEYLSMLQEVFAGVENIDVPL